MQQIINQATNQQERNNSSWYAAAETKPLAVQSLCTAFAESNTVTMTISSELAPHAHRPLESGPRTVTAPLPQCVGSESHPSPRLPATKRRAVWYYYPRAKAHARLTSDKNDS